MSEIIYGIHALHALLENGPYNFINVFLLKGYKSRQLQSITQELEQAGVIVHAVSRQWLDKKSKGAVHQGIIAYIHPKQKLQECDLPKILAQKTMPFLLVLDGITDTHNFGACLRCADAAGVHAVIVPRDRAAPLNATAKKVASGAAEVIPIIRVTNLARTLRFLKKNNVWIVGTAIEADHHLYQSKLTGSLALVIGSEYQGIRFLTGKCCDEIIKIPMFGAVSSLNVSVAAGICLFEAVRQRN